MVRGKSRKQWVSETFSLIVKSLSLFNVNKVKICVCVSLCVRVFNFLLWHIRLSNKSLVQHLCKS